MPNFEVPQWLQPPSEAEQQRLDMAASAARERAGLMMKRYLGSQRMKADAQAAMANGVDQRTAMQNALLNNAHLLFADNPEAISSIVNHEEANAVRERANFQLNQYREGMLNAKSDALEQAKARLEFEKKANDDKLQLARDNQDLRAQNEAQKRTFDLMKLQQGIDLASAKLEAVKNKMSPAAQEATDYADLQEQLREQNKIINDQTVAEDTPETTAARAKARRLTDMISQMEARHGMEEVSVTTPTGETMKLTKGPAKGKDTSALTGTETSKLGEDVMASANSLRVLNDLQSQLTSNAVGAIPSINSVVFDRILGQFDKDLVDQQRQNARNNIGIATQQVLGELNNRGRFSNMELKAIKDLMPSEGMMESPERAKIAVQSLRKVLAEKGAKAAVQLKRQIPVEILRTLSEYSDTELAQEVKNGALDNPTYWAVYDYKHGGK